MKCDKCGAEYQEGDYPFCPHGAYKNATGDDRRIIVDDLNFEKPHTFTSRGDFEKALKRNGLEPRNPSFKKSDKGRWV